MKTIEKLELRGTRVLKKAEMKQITGGESLCCYDDGIWTQACGGSCEVWCKQLYGPNADCR